MLDYVGRMVGCEVAVAMACYEVYLALADDANDGLGIGDEASRAVACCWAVHTYCNVFYISIFVHYFRKPYELFLIDL